MYIDIPPPKSVKLQHRSHLLLPFCLACSHYLLTLLLRCILSGELSCHAIPLFCCLWKKFPMPFPPVCLIIIFVLAFVFVPPALLIKKLPSIMRKVWHQNIKNWGWEMLLPSIRRSNLAWNYLRGAEKNFNRMRDQK